MTNVNEKAASSKGSKSAKGKEQEQITTDIVVLGASNKEEEQVITSIEEALQKQAFTIEDKIQKLASKKEEITNVNALLEYWKEANKALTFLESEAVKTEIVVTVNNEHGAVTLKSTKIETVRKVIALLSESSKERIQKLTESKLLD